MAAPSGEDVAAVLLRALPADVAEVVLGRMGVTAEQLRARVQQQKSPPSDEELDAALTAFFDMQRIAERTLAESTPAGEYKPVAGGAPAKPAEPAKPPKPKKAPPPPPEPEEEEFDEVDDPPPKDPMRALRGLSADKLARALDGEPPPAIALVLGSLDPLVSGAVLKLMPETVRAEVGLRLTQPSPRNQALLEQLARAVAEKGRKLKRIPPEPSQEERILKLADMLRTISRGDRVPVLQKIETVDQELAAKVREKLYRFEDLLKVQDRPLQGLLTELDIKTIATALKGVDEEVKNKVTSNMSARSKEVLNEEMELLGSVPNTRVKEKQAEILALLRKHEEEGKIVLDE